MLYSYTPDGCNTCVCDIDTGLSRCTLIGCIDPISVDQNQCKSCIDGYEPSDDGLSCVEAVDEPCICPLLYAPVCCEGVTYSNDCFARCRCSGTISSGPCLDPVDEPFGIDYTSTCGIPKCLVCYIYIYFSLCL